MEAPTLHRRGISGNLTPRVEVARLPAPVEALEDEVWLVVVYALPASGALDYALHATPSIGGNTNSSLPYSGNLSTVHPRLFAAGSA